MSLFNPDLLNITTDSEVIINRSLIEGSDSNEPYYVFTENQSSQTLYYDNKVLSVINWAIGVPDAIGLPTNEFAVTLTPSNLASDIVYRQNERVTLTNLSTHLGFSITDNDLATIRQFILDNPPINWTQEPSLYYYDIDILALVDEQLQPIEHHKKAPFLQYLALVNQYGRGQVIVQGVYLLDEK